MSLVSGHVTGTGRGLPGVLVSNGRDVVRTTDDGAFSLPVAGPFVFISIPGGWWTEQWYLPAAEAVARPVVFHLSPWPADRHRCCYLTDPHPDARPERSWPAFEASLAEAEDDDLPTAIVHGGDVGGADELDRFAARLRRARHPQRVALGNHDIEPSADHPFAAFEARFGPTWYSFEVGRVHYVVLNGLRAKPDLGGYTNCIGGFSDDERAWLAADLAACDRPVVAFTHIPLHSTYCERRDTSIQAAPWWVHPEGEEIGELLARHGVRLVLQGHLHENERLLRDGVEYASTVSLCGRWWQAETPPERGCGDEPRGYRVIDADGDRLDHRYVSSAESRTDAEAEITTNRVGDKLEVWVNVYDAAPDTQVTVACGEVTVPAVATPRPGQVFGQPVGMPHHFRAEMPAQRYRPVGTPRIVATVSATHTLGSHAGWDTVVRDPAVPSQEDVART